VVLQTFEPENEVIRASARHDYATFYSREIEARRQLRYPPFSHLVRLEFRHNNPAEAENAARAIGERLKSMIDADKRVETDLIGPVPCAFAKLNGQYRWQVILRGPEPASLLRGMRLPEGWRVEVDPISLL
jgi:primosomal protein N' (replication factor Y)